MQYKRILLKLSGESLMGEQNYGIDGERLIDYVNEIKTIHEKGVQIGIVIGGGNIYRGIQSEKTGINRTQGDYMGMLATIINSLALQSALENIGVESVVLSGLTIDPICQKAGHNVAKEHFKSGKIVILSGGSGNPYFTTDSAAALRALEIEADVLLKGTRVDGIYTEDPEKNPQATKYDKISFKEAYEKKLNIMDLTAFTLCKENNLPIIVFDMNKKNNLYKIVNGENIGTIVSNF